MVDETFSKQDIHQNDIKEIYKILHKYDDYRDVTKSELKDIEIRLNRVIDWAKATSKSLNVPIKL